MARYRALALTCSRFTVVAGLLAAVGCGGQREISRDQPVTNPAGTAAPALSSRKVRAAAVAGLFYPGDKAALASAVDSLLQGAPTHYIPRLRGLVCPHAGYQYSGATAAIGYKTLEGRDVRTVVLLAPSHYAAFRGASVPDAEIYQTPLGEVPISEKARGLAAVAPFVLEPKCLVDRPAWWTQAPKPAPAEGQDTPETWEHSAEVQVPFLQRTLTHFALLPVIFGEVDPAQVAKALAPTIDNTTIIVASSDLSHYHPYQTAQMLDRQCVKAICDLDVDAMKGQEACGKGPILALMHLARQKGWKAQMLDYRNSGDVTSEKDRVVGYTAVAFFEPTTAQFDARERKFLLELARKAITSVVTSGSLPETSTAAVPPKLAEKRGCFVTLTKAGALRGCIGSLVAQDPLYQGVTENARNAALRDPRFPPVAPAELDKIRIEISVLTEPQPLPFSSPDDLLSKLRPNQDGVVLRMGFRTATFLPQVWAQLPDKVEFLNRLAEKAGCEPSAWRGKETTVSVYQVESFEED